MGRTPLELGPTASGAESRKDDWRRINTYGSGMFSFLKQLEKRVHRCIQLSIKGRNVKMASKKETKGEIRRQTVICEYKTLTGCIR